MGRCLRFFATQATISHETMKRICMGWDYQRTFREAAEQLCEHLDPSALSSEKQMNKFYFDNKPSIRDKKTLEHVLNPDWCPWCATFAEGFSRKPVVKASIRFSHSYGNNIWLSDWHFHRMYPGTVHNDFMNRFTNDSMYHEISWSDVSKMQHRLDALGTAYCTADREALDETTKVIEFCEQWLDEHDTRVIYKSEL